MDANAPTQMQNPSGLFPTLFLVVLPSPILAHEYHLVLSPLTAPLPAGVWFLTSLTATCLWSSSRESAHLLFLGSLELRLLEC